MVSSTQDESGAKSLVPPIQDHQHRTGRDSSIASTSQELWGSLTSYVRSSQLGPVLAVALVAIIILMQASILDSTQLGLFSQVVLTSLHIQGFVRKGVNYKWNGGD